MEASLLSSSSPPPLSSSAAAAPVSLRNWNQIFAPDSSSAPKVFNFSNHPSEPENIPFSSDKLAKGGDDWSLCLVGYSIGRRPFYEALLGAINKTWTLKGSLQLLSLSDGFFLLRFSCEEDYDMAWSKGVWFLLGKPFVLQKWHPKFKPKRENFATVPIWVKIHDLPLACWNSEGISRIASKIGVPLAADHLTEQKTRLTFARVCVLVDCNATYPDVIKVSLDGDIVELKVQYEWRPVPCDHCKSLVHYSSSCPQNPKSAENDQVNNFPKTRGRSFSKKPTNRFPSRPPTNNRPPRSDSRPKDSTIPSIAGPSTIPTSPKHLNSIGQPLHYQAHSPPPSTSKVIPQSNSLAEDLPSSMLPNVEPASNIIVEPVTDSTVANIPNLNIPTEEISDSSSSMMNITHKQSTAITSPNKFEILNSQIDSDQQDDLVSGKDFVGNSHKQPGKSKKQSMLETSKKSAKGKQSKKSQSQNTS
ncbi:RNA exonuclease 1 [Dendrobium catenatum]|uniref:RNA exonuclease 1 n=1 Tax=Dendrobium catenatum TaxID=906689 RepID=A0A2I0WGS5_9ASPA|nr:RNA exonuclease 1 [Dendrobium catenatum]